MQEFQFHRSKKMNIKAVEKILSANDLSLNNSHQSGLLIPKKLVSQKFFPELTNSRQNPRVEVRLHDAIYGGSIAANYIYYNNKYFGGTRSEYRLTGVISLLNDWNLKPGDGIIFERVSAYEYTVSFRKTPRKATTLSLESWNTIYGGNNGR